MINIVVNKNGIRESKQKYSVEAKVRKGVNVMIHSNCDSMRTAMTIKRNVETLLKELTPSRYD